MIPVLSVVWVIGVVLIWSVQGDRRLPRPLTRTVRNRERAIRFTRVLNRKAF